jgi:hypothetical protein
MVFVLDIQNVSSDLSSAQLVDLSTYGGANPDRDTLALFLYLYKRDASMVDTAITVSNTAPTTVTEWDFALPTEDGNFVYIIFGFPVWTAGSYTIDNCVEYAGVYYKALTTTSATPGTDPTKWAVITDILSEVLNLSNSNVTITQGYAFSTAVAEAGPIGDAMAALGPKIIAGACKNLNDASATIYGAALIESAWMNFRRQDYTQAQEIMDFVDQQFAAQYA